MDLNQTIERSIQKILLKSYENKAINIFDEFLQFCQEYFDKPVHTMAEIKLMRNTKLKGDIFEYFAVKYLKYCYGTKFDNVWLLKEVPDEILTELKLKRNDMGIDIICQVKNKTKTLVAKYYAVQVKYRKKGYRTNNCVSWKQLSTFYGLVNRTGPYEKHIVITNADYVRHIGNKPKKDQSICYKALRNISKEKWCLMSSEDPIQLEEDSKYEVSESQRWKWDIESIEEIREKRLKYFA